MRNLIRHIRSAHISRQAASDHAVRSAVIFAPHPDDETLGCGGTIVQRLRHGARVTVIVMTDGRSSHSHLMSAAELVAIRAREVRAACARLGVRAEDVLLLGFEDGRLTQQLPAAVERAAAIMRELRPDEVFVPSRLDGPPDHRATYDAVIAALGVSGVEATLYEYPVWLWHQWPWVSVPRSGWRASLRLIARSMRAGLGLRLIAETNYAVPIDDVLALKRAALEEHASQMTRLRPDPRWATLADVADGQFLDCFFGRHEPFRRTRIDKGRP